MKVTLSVLAESPPDDPKLLGAYVRRLATDLGTQFALLSNVLNGQLTFGDVDGAEDNIHGTILVFTSHATPGTEFAVTHNLGVVPVGFITLIPPQSGVLNKGATTWTTSTIYLTCTGSSQACTIFVLAPPQQTS